ncbi:MAG: hypothetical protein COB08_004995 [Rhodobacteraceae bacterium]|nr:hypothetical protein [Paracoccaceae bacterium]
MPPRCAEKVSRNRAIIARHAVGESYKSIAVSLGISYGRVLELAARERDRIFKLMLDDAVTTEPKALMAEYSVSEEALSNIVAAELDKFRKRQHEDYLRELKCDKEENEYLVRQASDFYVDFVSGSSIDEMSEESGIAESDILSLVTTHLHVLIEKHGLA